MKNWDLIASFAKDAKVFTQTDAKGDVKGLYVFPKDTSPPANLLATLAPGDKLVATSFTSDIAKQVGDKMREALIELLQQTKLAACNLDPRPVQIATQVELGADFGITGTVS